VPPYAAVAVGDLLACLVLGRPQVGAALRDVVPAGKRLGEGPVEDLPEVQGLPERQVLDQAEKVGACLGQGAADVVLAGPVELPEHGLANLSQIVVQTLFREVIDHRK
jgi:hypothetical protein